MTNYNVPSRKDFEFAYEVMFLLLANTTDDNVINTVAKITNEQYGLPFMNEHELVCWALEYMSFMLKE